MTRPRALDLLGLLVRLGLATVWLYSGIAKAVAPQETRLAVRAYRILPNSLADTLAAVLPYLEIGLGVLLILGLATRLAAILSAALFVVFIAGVISAAARGLSIDCGCFGGGGDVTAAQTNYLGEILRDTGFLAMALYLAIRPHSVASIDRLVLPRAAEPA